MRIFVKRNGMLKEEHQGRVFKKSEVTLKEDITSSIPPVNGVRAAIQQANKTMNQNGNVSAATTDLRHLDGASDSNSVKGMKIQIPSNANGQQINKVQQMVNSQSSDDAELEVVKPNNGTTTTNESKLYNLRATSVPFFKKEMNDFLKTI